MLSNLIPYCPIKVHYEINILAGTKLFKFGLTIVRNSHVIPSED